MKSTRRLWFGIRWCQVGWARWGQVRSGRMRVRLGQTGGRPAEGRSGAASRPVRRRSTAPARRSQGATTDKTRGAPDSEHYPAGYPAGYRICLASHPSSFVPLPSKNKRRLLGSQNYRFFTGSKYYPKAWANPFLIHRLGLAQIWSLHSNGSWRSRQQNISHACIICRAPLCKRGQQ